jgi:hypothetical protein
MQQSSTHGPREARFFAENKGGLGWREWKWKNLAMIAGIRDVKVKVYTAAVRSGRMRCDVSPAHPDEAEAIALHSS